MHYKELLAQDATELETKENWRNHMWSPRKKFSEQQDINKVEIIL